MSLLVVFWYGILHAFGPDHLTAIADFSIGKNKQKTLLITVLFAFGHGFSLFLFAKLLQSIQISEEILAYGDIISATVIIGSGDVDFTMVGAFTAGVMLIFIGFGLVLLYFNNHFLGSLSNVRRAFTVAGVVSLLVGTNILLS